MNHKKRFIIGFIAFATLIQTVAMILALLENPLIGLILFGFLIYASGFITEGILKAKPELIEELQNSIR